MVNIPIISGLAAAFAVLAYFGQRQNLRREQLRQMTMESLGLELVGQVIPGELGAFPLWKMQFTSYVEPAWRGTLDGRAAVVGDFWYVGPLGRNRPMDRTWLTLVVFTDPVDGVADAEIWPRTLLRVALDNVHGDTHRTYADGTIGVQAAGGRILVFTSLVADPVKLPAFLHAAEHAARQLRSRGPS